jgi:hypothetical protein
MVTHRYAISCMENHMSPEVDELETCRKSEKLLNMQRDGIFYQYKPEPSKPTQSL